jgi:hypothetical protein
LPRASPGSEATPVALTGMPSRTAILENPGAKLRLLARLASRRKPRTERSASTQTSVWGFVLERSS